MTICKQDPGGACYYVLDLVERLADVAISLLGYASGGCRFQEAEIYIKNDGSPVIADWNPAHAYSEGSSDETQAHALWDDGLVPLLSKSLTGVPHKPNHLYHQDGKSLRKFLLKNLKILSETDPVSTGRPAMKIVRLLVHFFWDFRRQILPSKECVARGDSIVTLVLTSFIDEIRMLRDHAGQLQSHDDEVIARPNLLHTALLHRCSDWLCGIWDVWEVLDAEPGDVGYMMRGSDKRRPKFKKLLNIYEEAKDDPVRSALGIQFRPMNASWSSHSPSPGLHRSVP
ncbi:hypothetical protein K439DRAFT_954681 [Ramaria rubella]|nr:hypothetical protein K439DRAFT_954681 [Ramaria rubella]